jgi:hypothetical protein
MARKTLKNMKLAEGETDTGKRAKCWQCRRTVMIVHVKVGKADYGEQPRCPNNCGPESLGRLLRF